MPSPETPAQKRRRLIEEALNGTSSSDLTTPPSPPRTPARTAGEPIGLLSPPTTSHLSHKRRLSADGPESPSRPSKKGKAPEIQTDLAVAFNPFIATSPVEEKPQIHEPSEVPERLHHRLQHILNDVLLQVKVLEEQKADLEMLYQEKLEKIEKLKKENEEYVMISLPFLLANHPVKSPERK